MIIEKARYEILTHISHTMVSTEVTPGITITNIHFGTDELKALELIARTCYKSEEKISKDISSAEKLIRSLIEQGHESMLEHMSLTVKFICDRAMSHELVRHRLCAFAQESQRYCNYSKDKFDSSVTFIQPYWMGEDDIGYESWKRQCKDSELTYFGFLEMGYTPQQARIVLPNCTKTELVVTANWREWRHILKLRTAANVYPDLRHLMVKLLIELKARIPVVFDDIAC